MTRSRVPRGAAASISRWRIHEPPAATVRETMRTARRLDRSGGERMRRTVLGIALVLMLVAGLVPAIADTHEGDEGDKKFTITGEVRARWEYFENLTDFA